MVLYVVSQNKFALVFRIRNIYQSSLVKTNGADTEINIIYDEVESVKEIPV